MSKNLSDRQAIRQSENWSSAFHCRAVHISPACNWHLPQSYDCAATSYCASIWHPPHRNPCCENSIYPAADLQSSMCWCPSAASALQPIGSHHTELLPPPRVSICRAAASWSSAATVSLAQPIGKRQSCPHVAQPLQYRSRNRRCSAARSSLFRNAYASEGRCRNSCQPRLSSRSNVAARMASRLGPHGLIAVSSVYA
jgi:hypothetical protein